MSKFYGSIFTLIFAVLLVGTNFYLRDAMQARSMLACSVRPSVCPSVTFVDHVKTINISSKFFHHLVATPF